MIEVLKQAAEDVSKAYDVLAFAHTERALELLAKTRTSLRQAIKELESQEPVGWWDAKLGFFEEKHFDQLQPLYTHPTQRTWVGLSMEQFEHFTSYVRADVLVEIEEALMENNT